MSSIPYRIELRGGNKLEVGTGQETDLNAISTTRRDPIKRLHHLSGARLKILSSRLYTRPSSALLVQVSTARKGLGDTQISWHFGFQIFAKACSITVFVFGTCVFAGVSLLAMPMAQLVTMLILAAGLGSRTISRGIVSQLFKSEPMIHIITTNEQDSVHAIMELFTLHEEEGFSNGEKPHYQIELDGHVFVDGQRVARRNVWLRRMFGILLLPFDLAKVKEVTLAGEEVVTEC